MMDYSDYLRTPHWQSVRAAALQRAQNRCMLCDTPHRLEVHHRTYARRGHENPEDVVVLCAGCHRHHHKLARAGGPSPRLIALVQQQIREGRV